jgi:glycerol kinase
MSKIVMALDQGTSSSRTVLFDEEGNVLGSASEAFDSSFPQSGWVEQNPEEIWSSQKNTIKAALSKAGLEMSQITAIGITNQRETVIAWNKETGAPIGTAIVWQCRRTADFCRSLVAEGFDSVIRNKTGLVTDAYFSGTKMHWMLQNRKEAKELADKGKLLFGTVDSWLIWKLTGGREHVTDGSNASRTLVYNIFENKWDEEILERLGIPRECLPEVKGSSEIVGYTDKSEWGAEVPISGVAGDQQAALFGQACFEKGMAKNTYGTGCFLLMNSGTTPKLSEHGLLTTIAWKIGDEVTYAQEGSVFMGGALVQWLRDKLELFKDVSETEAMAELAGTTGGLYIVPAFVGLGAPHWDSYARGLMIGLTRDTNKNHMVRAALEAIAYQSYDLLKCMEKDSGAALKVLRVDGGATANNFLCQFQADLLQIDVSRPQIIETTAMGAAFLAGLATGVWEDLEHITKMWKEDRRFQAQRDKSSVGGLIEGWQRALDRSKGWLPSA